MEVLNTIDWRRRTFALYAEVRAIADPADAHAHWCTAPADVPHPPGVRRPAVTLEVAPYDPAWRFEVAIQDAEPASFEYETGTDGLVTFERVGIVDVPEVGSLDVWRHERIRRRACSCPSATPRRDTYGGGRYLLDTIKGADLGFDADAGTLVLDFNFAYNPSCAYDPAWACPLAPPGDRVAVPIPVGERYRGEH